MKKENDSQKQQQSIQLEITNSKQKDYLASTTNESQSQRLNTFEEAKSNNRYGDSNFKFDSIS